MYVVEVLFDTDDRGLAAEMVVEAARAALTHEQAPAGEMTVLLAGDDRLAELNRQFMGEDGPTDVLAFPSGESTPAPELPVYLGDVAISLDRAKSQAEAAGHTLLQESQLLVVHGTLHLLGHDHSEPDEKRVMWLAQNEILGQLGVPTAFLDALLREASLS